MKITNGDKQIAFYVIQDLEQKYRAKLADELATYGNANDCPSNDTYQALLDVLVLLEKNLTNA